MMMTLYDCATAPSPRRARLLLAAKGIAHETVQIDLRAGEQLAEAFRKINPQCTVPALRTEEGDVLIDNAGIAAYLEAALQEGDPQLVAAALGDIARAKGMSQVARDAGLGRESLYKSLSSSGNPELATLLKVISALDLELHVTAAGEAKMAI